MKKIVSILLVLVTVLSMGTMAFADGTTTLTTTVPAATYTLNIPADQTIKYGETRTNIGSISVSNSAGFAEGKGLKVYFNYSAFTSEDVSTEIPFAIWAYNSKGEAYVKVDSSGGYILFMGHSDGTVTEYPIFETTNPRKLDTIYVEVESNAWGKALAGDYTATITFTSEVVVE